MAPDLPRSLRTLLLSASVLLAAPAAFAQGVDIVPGSWEITSTVKAMAGQPQTETVTECIAEDNFDLQRLVRNAQQCSIVKSSQNGDEVTGTLRCDTPMGPATGDMRFRSHDDEIEGGMTITMNLNGQDMKIETSWKGRRVGDCD